MEKPIAKVKKSNRNTNIFRRATNFEEVLAWQQANSIRDDVVDPTEKEAEYLFVIKDNMAVDSVIKEIVRISNEG